MEKQVNCAVDCLNGCILGDRCPNQAHAAEAAKFIAETSLEKMLEMAEAARLKKLTQPTQWIIPVDILAAVKRTAIPKPHDLGFCFFTEGFFAPALTDLLCSGLMVALQTDTASPAAKIFLSSHAKLITCPIELKPLRGNDRHV